MAMTLTLTRDHASALLLCRYGLHHRLPDGWLFLVPSGAGQQRSGPEDGRSSAGAVAEGVIRAAVVDVQGGGDLLVADRHEFARRANQTDGRRENREHMLPPFIPTEKLF